MNSTEGINEEVSEDAWPKDWRMGTVEKGEWLKDGGMGTVEKGEWLKDGGIGTAEKEGVSGGEDEWMTEGWQQEREGVTSGCKRCQWKKKKITESSLHYQSSSLHDETYLAMIYFQWQKTATHPSEYSTVCYVTGREPGPW